MINFKMFHKKFAEFLLKILGGQRVTRTIRRTHRKVGRNEPCRCGTHEPTSNNPDVMRPKKYKKCHWAEDVARGVR
jgi:hypothetical protein